MRSIWKTKCRQNSDIRLPGSGCSAHVAKKGSCIYREPTWDGSSSSFFLCYMPTPIFPFTNLCFIHGNIKIKQSTDIHRTKKIWQPPPHPKNNQLNIYIFSKCHTPWPRIGDEVDALFGVLKGYDNEKRGTMKVLTRIKRDRRVELCWRVKATTWAISSHLGQ